jgi:hypothetical protein
LIVLKQRLWVILARENIIQVISVWTLKLLLLLLLVWFCWLQKKLSLENGICSQSIILLIIIETKVIWLDLSSDICLDVHILLISIRIIIGDLSKKTILWTVLLLMIYVDWYASDQILGLQILNNLTILMVTLLIYSIKWYQCLKLLRLLLLVLEASIEVLLHHLGWHYFDGHWYHSLTRWRLVVCKCTEQHILLV